MLLSLEYGDPNFFDMSDEDSIWYNFREFIDGMLDVKYKDVFNFFDKLSIKYKLCGKALQTSTCINICCETLAGNAL